MLFHEMYGAYFRTVSLILQEAVDGGITEKRIREIVAEHAFAESTLVIPAKLVSGEWLPERMDRVSGCGNRCLRMGPQDHGPHWRKDGLRQSLRIRG